MTSLRDEIFTLVKGFQIKEKYTSSEFTDAILDLLRSKITLEWEAEQCFHCSEIWVVKTPMGLYSCFENHEELGVFKIEIEDGYYSPEFDKFDNMQDAKAAALEDYRNTIMSILEGG